MDFCAGFYGVQLDCFDFCGGWGRGAFGAEVGGAGTDADIGAVDVVVEDGLGVVVGGCYSRVCFLIAISFCLVGCGKG